MRIRAFAGRVALVAAFLSVALMPAVGADRPARDTPLGPREAADVQGAQSLTARLTPQVLAAVWPNAERLGPVTGDVPAVTVFKGDQPVGYIFSTLDVTHTPGYSGTPFDVIAGVDLDGKITGAKLIFHREPHIDTDAMENRLGEFLSSLRNVDGSYPKQPDFVGGATVSARTMKSAVTDGARIVLRAHSPRPPVTEPTLDVDAFKPMNWEQLLAEGSLRTNAMTGAQVMALAQQEAGPDAQLEEPVQRPEQPYIEFFTALATPAAVGENIADIHSYNEFIEKRPKGSQVIFVGSNGQYDFLGNTYHQKAKGYKFDRVSIVQGDKTFTFDRDGFQRLDHRTPHWNDYGGLYYIPAEAGFDPLKPWRLDLAIHGTSSKGPFTLTLPIEYSLPASHILLPEPPPVPAWVEAWTDAKSQVGILGGALVVLTLLLAFQSRLTRYRRLHRWARNGFLLFTLVWLGWMSGGQLSTIHLFNYALAPFRNFDFAFYLAEPLIFMIAAYAIVGVILLGRGVFCGWLCPFGAMQELLAQVARFLKVPQWNPPEWLQRKLWLGKYLSAAALIGVVFIWPATEATATEIEPFKTAITSMFLRPWPFVVYAVALLTIGLFTERAYCRFLCPLGGVLAALDRLHLIDMLKRREECGSPCRLCEHSCPVKAIERSGAIRMAECFQCLDCQVEYYDEHRCPPLAKARKLRLRRRAADPVGASLPVPAFTRTSTAV